MYNMLSLFMLTAMLVYVLFILYKRNKANEISKGVKTKHFESALLGLVIGLLIGIFGSSAITEFIFTENYLDTHSNPDVGLFGYYFLTTFFLMVICSILSTIIYNVYHKKYNNGT